MIWKRDQGKCVQCGGQHALQIDHILPFSEFRDRGPESGLETPHDPNNLRLLCRDCNVIQGIKNHGLKAMNRQ